MEKVISYRAFNGKLFDTEEKCIAYEKKMYGYPKTIHEQVRIHNTLNIVKHTITTKKTPNSPKESKIYYVVNDKYKLSNMYDSVYPLTEKEINEAPKYPNAARIEYFVINAILKYDNFNNEIATEAINGMKRAMNWSRFEIKEHTENCWLLEDNRWHLGIASPCDCWLKIEKI